MNTESIQFPSSGLLPQSTNRPRKVMQKAPTHRKESKPSNHSNHFLWPEGTAYAFLLPNPLRQILL